MRMRLYKLTQLGWQMAGNPRGGDNGAWRALYYIRKRRGGPVSLEELQADGITGRDLYALKGGKTPLIVEVGGGDDDPRREMMMTRGAYQQGGLREGLRR